MRVFPTFRSRRLEREYRIHIQREQEMADMSMELLGLVSMAVVTWQAWEGQLDVPIALFIMTSFAILLPVTIQAFNRHDAPKLRDSALCVWIVGGWHYNFAALVALGERPSSQGSGLLTQRLQRWLDPRTRLMLLFWGNLGRRLPIRLHVLAHAAGVLVTLPTNEQQCRWAVQHGQRSWAQLAAFMRHFLRVPPPAAGSFPASPVGMCIVSTNFLQMVFAWLLPCYLTLLMELKSRFAFLSKSVRQSRRRRLPEPGRWRARRLLNQHLAWQVAFSVVICWQLSEAAARYFHGGMS